MMNLKFWQKDKSRRAQARMLPAGFWQNIYSNEPGISTGYGPRSNGSVVSCVSRIVSRALEIPYVSRDPEVQNVLDNPSWMKSVDPRMMWSRLYECVLYDGNGAILLTASNKLRVGQVQGVATVEERKMMNPMTGKEEVTSMITRSFRTQRIGDASTETIQVSEPDVCRIHWSESMDSPWQVISKEAMAYSEMMDDLYQEGKHARRITNEIEFTDTFSDPSMVDEKLSEMNKLLNSGRKYITVALAKGVNYSPRQPVSSPDHGGRVGVSLASVARVYGVPLQLLQSGVWRQSIDQSDAHLLRDAVLPLVNDVAAGLSKIFKSEVKVDMRKVGLPSRTGTAGLLMQLGQSGVLTINEIREQAGFDPIEGGDVLPQTAGAAERPGGEMGTEGDDDGDDGDE